MPKPGDKLYQALSPTKVDVVTLVACLPDETDPVMYRVQRAPASKPFDTAAAIWAESREEALRILAAELESAAANKLDAAQILTSEGYRLIDQAAYARAAAETA